MFIFILFLCIISPPSTHPSFPSSISLRSAPSPFPFRKEQASYEYQLNMAKDAIGLGRNPHIKAGKRQPRRKKMILRAGKRVRDSPAPVVRNSTEYQATQL